MATGYTASGAPLPSPAPTLPTPHFPGEFPVTPSPSAYYQSEGPLEAAGRSIHSSNPEAEAEAEAGRTAPAALLGAAAGMLVGGVGGALVGASLVGGAEIEDEALRGRGVGEGREAGSVGGEGGVTRGVDGGEVGLVPSSGGAAGGGQFVALDFPVEDRAKTPTPAAATRAPVSQFGTDPTTAGESLRHKEEAALAGVTGVAAGAAPVIAAKGHPAQDATPTEPIHGVVHTTDTTAPSSGVTTAGETLHRREEAALAGVTGVGAGSAAVIATKGLPEPERSADEDLSHGMVHTSLEDKPPASGVATAGEGLHEKEVAALAGVTGVGAGAAAVIAAKEHAHPGAQAQPEPVHNAMNQRNINDQSAPTASGALYPPVQATNTEADSALLREAGIQLRPAVSAQDLSRTEPSTNAMRHRDANDVDVKDAAPASAVPAGLAAPAESGAPAESPGIHTAAGVAFFDGDHLLADDVKEMLQKPSDNVTTTTQSSTTHHYHQLEPVVHTNVIHHHYYAAEDGVPVEVVEAEPVVHNPPTAIDKGKGREVFDGREVAEVAGLSAGAEAIHEYLENRDELAAQAGITPAERDVPTRDFANLSVNDPQQQATPREALEAGLTSAAPLAPVESGSRFYEQLDGARRPGLVSHFSDATVQTAANNTAPPTPAVAGKIDPFITQRVETGNLHEVVPGPGRKIALTDLRTEAIPVAAAGFAVPEGARPATQAQADFAHLSSPAATSSVAAVSPVDPEGAAAAARLEDEYVPLAAGAGLAGIGAGSMAYAGTPAQDLPDDNWSTRAIPPDTPGLSGTPPATPRALKGSGLRENLLVGSLAPTADDLNSGINTPSSTRASRGSPPPLVGQQTFLDESRVRPSDDEYAPVSPVQRSAGHSRQNSIDRAVHRSPHLKVATRADSIGHNRLVKKHVKVPAEELARVQQHQHQHQSPTGSPRIGSPAQPASPARSVSPVVAGAGSQAQSSPMGRRRSGSAGAELWDHSVANVVNDETVHRHGHRPQLVSIPSEDRRDMGQAHGQTQARGVGSPRSQQGQYQQQQQQQQPRSPRQQQHVQIAPPVPAVGGIEPARHSHGHGSSQGSPILPDGPSGPNKLRRKSSVARDEREKEKDKTGVFARIFGGHKKTASSGGGSEAGGSPRASGEFGRG